MNIISGQPENPSSRRIIAALSVLILAGGYLVLADYRAWWPYAPSPSETSYVNERYGLRIILPGTWSGFKDVTGAVDGTTWIARDTSTSQEVASGPIITIRHPLWRESAPRQDIPVMVFTPDQWVHVGAADGDWSVGAAPIPPSELTRNSRYVFALPARYNYAFLEGWQEVQAIIDSGAITSFEPARQE